VWPYLRHLAEVGLEQAVQDMPALGRGIAIRDGHIVNKALAAAFYAGTGG